MNSHRLIALAGSALLPLLVTGCVSGTRAVPSASLRSGCEADAIEVVSQDGHDLVLDVCGTYESWRWHALNGWEYVGMASSQPLRGPVDADADGVPDEVDACPAVAGQSSADRRDNGCPPPPDQDADGVVDPQDACPNVVGAAQADPSKNGCPLDGDSDGIVDAEDACPSDVGTPSDDASTNGCPAEQAGDGVMDADDACPSEAGSRRPDDAARNGCPAPTDDAPSAGDASEAVEAEPTDVSP